MGSRTGTTIVRCRTPRPAARPWRSAPTTVSASRSNGMRLITRRVPGFQGLFSHSANRPSGARTRGSCGRPRVERRVECDEARRCSTPATRAVSAGGSPQRNSARSPPYRSCALAMTASAESSPRTEALGKHCQRCGAVSPSPQPKSMIEVDRRRVGKDIAERTRRACGRSSLGSRPPAAGPGCRRRRRTRRTR